MIRRWWGKRNEEEGYQPIGDSVSWDIALSQAVTALDHAAELSIKTNSPSGMREVAVGWLAVANALEAVSEGEESELSSQDGDDMYPKVGFMGAPMRAEPVDEEEEDEEEFEDDPESHHTFPTSRIARSRGKGQDRQVMRGVRRPQ